MLGCGPAPGEVVGVYEGQDSSSGRVASDGPSGGSGISGSSGPVADGSAGSGTGPAPGTSDTTATVDPSTSGPGTTTTVDPTDSTGPAVTTVDPSTSSGDPPPPPTCDDLFGSAPGYELCFEDDMQCGFDLDTGDQSCNTVCASFGSTCLGAFDNPGGSGGCSQEGVDDCNTVHNTEICVCSRP